MFAMYLVMNYWKKQMLENNKLKNFFVIPFS